MTTEEKKEKQSIEIGWRVKEERVKSIWYSNKYIVTRDTDIWIVNEVP
jgi:hypothetical protein